MAGTGSLHKSSPGQAVTQGGAPAAPAWPWVGWNVPHLPLQTPLGSASPEFLMGFHLRFWAASIN